MRKKLFWYLVASLVVGLALLVVSCGGGTTKPAEEKAVTLASVSVTPSSASIEVGQTKSYAATGTYSDGKTTGITTQVTWRSSNTAVATISSAGLATTVGAGTTTITATLDTVSGTASLTVTAVVVSTGPPVAPKALHEALFAATPPGCTGCHTVGGAGVGAPGGTGIPGPGSANDHTGRTSDTCKTCHQLSP